MNRSGLLTCCCLFILTVFSIAQPRKWGLLVGVSNYAPGSKIKPLSSHNDIVLIEKALNNIGFQKEEIIILEDSNATKTKIMTALEQGLLKNIKAGDFVYFHFSGHGQQIYDDNGDEYDGLDESILPYDASMIYKKGQPENHLRDDYLGEIFGKIQTKLGGAGQVVVCLDACHSGTGTRGISSETELPAARGTALIYGEPNNQVLINNPSQNSSQDNYGVTMNADGKATMVCFFGASPQELNYEYWSKDIRAGSLSYSIYKAMSKMEKGTTFRDIYVRIKSIMSSIAPQQFPQAEGNLNKVIFANDFVKPQIFFTPLGEPNGRKMIVNAGTIDGVTDSSTFSVRKSIGTLIQEIGVAKVVTKSLTTTELILDWDLPKDSAVFLKYYLQKKKPRYVATVNTSNASAWKKWVQECTDEDYDVTALNGPAFLNLKEVQDKGVKKLVLSNSTHIVQQWDLGSKTSEQIVLELQKKIKKVAWSKFLRNLNSQSEECKISAEIWVLPFDTLQKKPLLQEPVKKIANFNNLISMGPSECYKINIRNESNKKLYYTIIDLQPDEVANFLVPYGSELPSSFSIAPFESSSFPGFDYYLEISPPLGIETLKIIASTHPIDFSGLSTKGNGSVSYSLMDEQEDDLQLLGTGSKGSSSKIETHILTLSFKITN